MCATWHGIVWQNSFVYALLRRALCRHNLLHSAAPAAASRFFALSTYKFCSCSLSLCCSFGFCLSCEQLSSCKFIDSTCGCSLATFVFVCSLISMCKLIKASKSKLKHFAPAADGNSIQLHRLELNRIEEKRRGSVCVATSRIRVGTHHLL